MKQKDFTRRDSATSFLRKNGIDKADYNNYINVYTDQYGSIYNIELGEDGKPVPAAKVDKLAIPTEVAKALVKLHSAPKTSDLPDRSMAIGKPGKEVQKSAPSSKAESVKNKAMNKLFAGKRTVSSAIRDLIKAGKTNAEIWAVVQPEFKLADTKKHYPGWYRSELARKGAV